MTGKRYFYGLFAFNWTNLFSPAAFIAGTPSAPTQVSAIVTTTEDVLAMIQAQIIEIQNKIKELMDILQQLIGERRLQIEQKIHLVRIESLGFNPRVITISPGETVRWINATEREVWPASDTHDTHILYPEPGGCVGSLFDTCQDLLRGEAFSFTFDKIGTWNYHDHLEPGTTGTIIVK